MTEENRAYDINGNKLPFNQKQIREVINHMMEQGEIVAVIIKVGNDLGVQVFGPPSDELIGILEQTLEAYKHAVADHKKMGVN